MSDTSEYTITRFKPSGKWYDDSQVTFPDDIKGYANSADVLKAYYGDPTKWDGYWTFVMMKTPWGYPIMIPSTQSRFNHG